MAGPVKAYNFTQGDSAAVVGDSRSRIRQDCNLRGCGWRIYNQKR